MDGSISILKPEDILLDDVKFLAEINRNADYLTRENIKSIEVMRTSTHDVINPLQNMFTKWLNDKN